MGDRVPHALDPTTIQPSPHRPPNPAQRLAGFALSKLVTLTAVGAVLVIISVPRLRSFAMQENETDARSLVRQLGAVLERHSEVLGSEVLGSGVPGSGVPGSGVPGSGVLGSGELGFELLIGDLPLDEARLRVQFRDREALEGGHLLRLHGYLFDLHSTAEGHAVRAWPWIYGQTGHAAYVFTADGALLRHPNPKAAWSGAEGAPAGPWASEGGWQLLTQDADYR